MRNWIYYSTWLKRSFPPDQYDQSKMFCISIVPEAYRRDRPLNMFAWFTGAGGLSPCSPAVVPTKQPQDGSRGGGNGKSRRTSAGLEKHGPEHQRARDMDFTVVAIPSHPLEAEGTSGSDPSTKTLTLVCLSQLPECAWCTTPSNSTSETDGDDGAMEDRHTMSSTHLKTHQL